MSVNIKCGTTFEIMYVSILYSVRIVTICDTLPHLPAYHILSNSDFSDRNIYLYYHVYKSPTTPCIEDIRLNHFAYLDLIEYLDECPTTCNREINYSDHRRNTIYLYFIIQHLHLHLPHLHH